MKTFRLSALVSLWVFAVIAQPRAFGEEIFQVSPPWQVGYEIHFETTKSQADDVGGKKSPEIELAFTSKLKVIEHTENSYFLSWEIQDLNVIKSGNGLSYFLLLPQMMVGQPIQFQVNKVTGRYEQLNNHVEIVKHLNEALESTRHIYIALDLTEENIAQNFHSVRKKFADPDILAPWLLEDLLGMFDAYGRTIKLEGHTRYDLTLMSLWDFEPLPAVALWSPPIREADSEKYRLNWTQGYDQGLLSDYLKELKRKAEAGETKSKRGRPGFLTEMKFDSQGTYIYDTNSNQVTSATIRTESGNEHWNRIATWKWVVQQP